MVATTIEDLHADVLARALRRLDGRSLAAASCATASLRALAADPDTWRTLCLAEWPSLAGHQRLLAAVAPRRLFADAFPFPCPDGSELVGVGDGGALPLEIVSAVDVYYRGAPLLSRVVETLTSSSWFLGSPFRVEAVECKKPVAAAEAVAVASPEELELSWVVVDAARGRAVNVSSRRAVAVDRHWYTGETLARFAVVLGGCKFEATVTCSSEGTGHVTEVSLAVQDADGAAASGERSLRLLAAAMEEQRIGGGERQREEAKRRYDEFLRRQKGRKESKVRREALIDLCCSAASAMAVLCFLAAVVLR